MRKYAEGPAEDSPEEQHRPSFDLCVVQVVLQHVWCSSLCAIAIASHCLSSYVSTLPMLPTVGYVYNRLASWLQAIGFHGSVLQASRV